ncbi:DUF4255 domain-containing protein [Nitrosomonas ureae]|uniref:Pvc16 N-terminal domain-containing protein n=1 Tax=Nitrosomonas ureae TaxID=44577 RepID=A0A1H9D1H3_9PROT|nr:DUF4255 domain-containing protein [Nitrosomonas ureae]SEQ07315.1 Protein of unknown function [Nitrosomonas ureae]
MANYRAITAVVEALLQQLRDNYQFSDFNSELDFKAYVAKDFSQPMKAGVSLFLYRIFPNNIHRTPTGQSGPDGQLFRTQLPLDLHFLLTAWAPEASLQHTIAGWMMREFEDIPILPVGLLNQNYPDLFHADERVIVTPVELTTEELFRIWDVIVHHAYQISVPYVARVIKIDSKRLRSGAGRPVQERTLGIVEATQGET